MSHALRSARCALFILLCCAAAAAKPVHNYVFFGQDRERLHAAASFLETKALEGAQVTYSWRQLEPEEDKYDFQIVREDLALLTSKGKRLFIQLQDVTFSESRINVPRYLLSGARYNGGADKQYRVEGEDEGRAVVAGWMARRWDPAVQERFHKLLDALGREFDGRVEGINFAETSVGVGHSGRLFPKGFTFEAYREGIITNMKALRRAFPRSVVMQYANFMPGEWLPGEDRGHLRAVYKAAKELGVGVGGPDLLPHRRGQLNHSYPLIRDASGVVPTGIAVQDGNYAEPDPRTGKPPTAAELLRFATEFLKVDYVFWCTEEPYYSGQVIPFFRQAAAPPGRQVAVTFDDLPAPQGDLEDMRRITSRLLESVTKNGVPAVGFVNEGKLYRRGETDARTDLLRAWLDAGLELGNHTFSHINLHRAPLEDYKDDVLRGETVTRMLLRERGQSLRYFRHPFLFTGATPEYKKGLAEFLAARGYTVAPVTVDNGDYVFADVYFRAKKRGDAETARRVADAYVPYMESVFEHFERLAAETFGREIRHVLLLHANEINADRFDELAAMLRRRGYRFVTLEEALKDAAYREPDALYKNGISWLHRWRMAKGLPTKWEPEWPKFVDELYKAGRAGG